LSSSKAVLDAFQRFSSDATSLTRHELKCAFMAVCGSKPSKAMIDMFMRNADGAGNVGFDTFRTQVQALLASSDPDEHTRQVFKAFDLKCAGFITRDVARLVFQNAAPAVNQRVVDEVFDELDHDYDGRVSCSDFITMMRIRNVPA